jgi:hypothetical protein
LIILLYATAEVAEAAGPSPSDVFVGDPKDLVQFGDNGIIPHNSTTGISPDNTTNVESSSRVQSTSDQIKSIAEFSTTNISPKPSWVNAFDILEGTKRGRSTNPILKGQLPWKEVQLNEIWKITRPKILGVNFNFLYGQAEVIFQEFKHEKAFYVSNVHIPGMTMDNYEKKILEYYELNASNKPTFVNQTILIKDGDPTKFWIFKGKKIGV